MPLGQVILCANTPEEHAELEAAGVRGILFNQNAALDERLFDVATPAEGEARQVYCCLCPALCRDFRRLRPRIPAG